MISMKALLEEAASRENYRILVHREDDWWVATWLEHDFVAQGKTMAEALESLAHSLRGHEVIHLENGLDPDPTKVARTPEMYWDLARKGMGGVA